MKDMSENLNLWLTRASLQAQRYAMLLGIFLLVGLVISCLYFVFGQRPY